MITPRICAILLRSSKIKSRRAKAHRYIYIANTLLNDGVVLETAMQIAKDAGADGFEVRREFMLPTRLLSEVQNLDLHLEMSSSPPIYSTPHPILNEGRFECKPPLQALTGAHSLDCCLVKFSPTGSEFVWLLRLRKTKEV